MTLTLGWIRDQSTYQSQLLHHQDRHYTWEHHPVPDVLTTRM